MDHDAPDIYADSINLAAGPFGFTLTLLLSDPDNEGQEAPGKVVGRVRVSPEMAGALADILRRAVDEYRKAQAASRKGRPE